MIASSEAPILRSLRAKSSVLILQAALSYPEDLRLQEFDL